MAGGVCQLSPLSPRGDEKGDHVVFRHLVGVGQPESLLAEPGEPTPDVAERLKTVGSRGQVMDTLGR